MATGFKRLGRISHQLLAFDLEGFGLRRPRGHPTIKGTDGGAGVTHRMTQCVKGRGGRLFFFFDSQSDGLMMKSQFDDEEAAAALAESDLQK